MSFEFDPSPFRQTIEKVIEIVKTISSTPNGMFVLPVDENVPMAVYPRTTNTPLDEIKEAIGGGWIELIYMKVGDDGVQMFGDEEGKIKRFPVNPRATALFLLSTPGVSEHIVGQVVILKGKAKAK